MLSVDRPLIKAAVALAEITSKGVACCSKSLYPCWHGNACVLVEFGSMEDAQEFYNAFTDLTETAKND